MNFGFAWIIGSTSTPLSSALDRVETFEFSKLTRVAVEVFDQGNWRIKKVQKDFLT